MAWTKREAWLKAGVTATFTFVTLATATAAFGAEVTEASVATDPFTAFVAFLRSTGPLGAAVLAGWWALRKDKEKNELAAAFQAQMKAMYDQIVGIVATQTAATAKMEGTIAALKDAIVALKRDGDD